MSNPNGRKGAQFETDLVRFLKPYFPLAERRVREGAKDRGDLAGIRDFVGEAKNCQRIDLAAFVKELEVEMENAGAKWGAVFVKRRGKSVADSYAVIPTWLFVKMLRRLEDG